ncbi:hypothetical protein HA466_0290140 [Hirschfeldia incana]|nr:hypothetical protein HA466_0290140 [Hirschfeldia incana]
MDRSTPTHNSSNKGLNVSYLVSLMVLCARHANRLSKKLKPKKRTRYENFDGRWNLTSSPMRFKAEKEKTATMKEEEHGLWQREILMGGKCEPLDFSGVIHYDRNGRQLREMPRGTPFPVTQPVLKTGRRERGSPLDMTETNDFETANRLCL